MNTCSNCRWWDREGKELPPHPSPRLVYVYRACTHPRMAVDSYVWRGWQSRVPHDGAGPLYTHLAGSDYGFGPEFSCRHHECLPSPASDPSPTPQSPP